MLCGMAQLQLKLVQMLGRFKPGSYVIGLTGNDSTTVFALEYLSSRMFVWDGGPGSFWPPRVAFEGARAIISRELNAVLAPLGLIAYVPKTNSLDPLKPPLGANNRIRKWWSPANKELLFWVDIKKNPSATPGTLDQAFQKLSVAISDLIPKRISVTQLPLPINYIMKIEAKMYQAAQQEVAQQKPEPLTPPPAPTIPGKPNVTTGGGSSNKPINVTVNIPPQNAGGGATSYKMPSGNVVTPKPSQIAVDGLTNPWLWAAGGLVLFGLTFVLKQARGGLRELGSGVRSTYDEARSGTDSLGADPDIPKAGRK